jgi:Sigma-70 region 2
MSLARAFARRSRRGSDELHPVAEAEFAEAGLYEDRGVADFDELCQVGREAVLEIRDRYNPERGPFQTFAYLRVRGAMVDSLRAQQPHPEEEHDSGGVSLATALGVAVRRIQSGEQVDSGFFEALYDALRDTTPEGWRDIMQEADSAIVRFFWGFLHRFADVVASEIGEDKRKAMLAVTTMRYWQLRFARAVDSGAPLRDISGPQHMEIIERGRKASGHLPSKVDDRPLGRMFGKDGKTVARWRTTLKEAGAPPLMREDGSFSLQSQDDWDEWVDYWMRVAEPQSWDRLQKRLQREA